MSEKKILMVLRQAVSEDCYCSVTYLNSDKAYEAKFFIRLVDLVEEDSRLVKLEVQGYNHNYHSSRVFTLLLESLIEIEALKEQTFADYPEEEKKRFLEILDRQLKRHKDFENLDENTRVTTLLDYYAEAQRADRKVFITTSRQIPGIDIDVLSDPSRRFYEVDEEQFDKLLSLLLKENEALKDESTAWIYILELSIKVKERLFIVAYHRLRFDLRAKKLYYDPNILFNPILTDEEERSGTPFSLLPGMTFKSFETTYREDKKAAIEMLTPLFGQIDTRPSCVLLKEEQGALSLELLSLKEDYLRHRWANPLNFLFGAKPLLAKPEASLFLSSSTNSSQAEALNMIRKHDISYIFGPPGTGKSHTIIDRVLASLFSGKSLLVAANANHPLDEIASKLDGLNENGLNQAFIPYFRVGTLQKMAADIDRIKALLLQLKEEDLRPFDHRNLDSINREFDVNAVRLGTDIKEELFVFDQSRLYHRLLLRKIGVDHLRRIYLYPELKRIIFYENYFGTDPSKTKLEQAVDNLRRVLRDPRGVKHFLDVFPIVISTCYSTAKFRRTALFDLVFLDEAASCPIIAGIYALRLGRKAALSGDQNQLSSFSLITKEQDRMIKKRYDLPDVYSYSNHSILDLLLANYPELPSTLLQEHYRCQADIIDFCNKNFYQNQMIIRTKSDGEKHHLYVEDLINECQESNSAPLEVDFILEDIDRRGLKDEETGIITPFVAQVKSIKKALMKRRPNSAIAVGTVHSFQGDQKRNIYFSLAISRRTSFRTIDRFVSDKRLINVAVSRAISLFVAVGDFHALRQKFRNHANGWLQLMDYSVNLATYSQPRVKSLEIKSKIYRANSEGASREEKELKRVLNQILSVHPEGRYELYTHVLLKDLINDPGVAAEYVGYHFDFVIKDPVHSFLVAIELDGPEHYQKIQKVLNDIKKTKILFKIKNMSLIRIENKFLYQYMAIKSLIENEFRRLVEQNKKTGQCPAGFIE